MTEESPLAITALKRKRSEIAGQIVELRRQLDKLQADIFHLDMVLRLYGEVSWTPKARQSEPLVKV
jgi:hypothetical protein